MASYCAHVRMPRASVLETSKPRNEFGDAQLVSKSSFWIDRKAGEEVFGGAGDFLGLVASNLIAGECVLKEKKERV